MNFIKRFLMALGLCAYTLSHVWAQNEFAQAAAKEPGAKVTASGLVFRSLQDGQGSSPMASDKVKVHYRGIFPDGKEFDSSYKRNQAIEFPLNGVIPCWTEGVQLVHQPLPMGHVAQGALYRPMPHFNSKLNSSLLRANKIEALENFRLQLTSDQKP